MFKNEQQHFIGFKNTSAAIFFNSFKNPCLSWDLDKGDMNGLKVNYIQIGKVLHVWLQSKSQSAFIWNAAQVHV